MSLEAELEAAVLSERWEQVQALADEWLRADPDALVPAVALSDAAARLGQPLRSWTALKPVRRARCEDPDRLASVWSWAGRLTDAHPQSAEAWRLHSAGLLLCEDFPEATRAAERTARLAPRDGHARVHLARCYALRRRFRKAEVEACRGLRLLGDNAMAYWARGLARAATGNFLGAARDLQRVEELCPRFPPLQGAWMALHVRKHEWQQALDRATEYLALDPYGFEAHAARGCVYLELGRLDDALAELDRAVELNSRHAATLKTRGVVRLKRGDYQGAIQDLTDSIASDPSDGQTYGFRAHAYHFVGATAEAGADERAALRLDMRERPGGTLRSVLWAIGQLLLGRNADELRQQRFGS